jgi:threonine/homoserine/homoserine lactone efflux protein
MTYAENLWLFFTLLFGIIIVPGMDMLFVLANSLSGVAAPPGISATAGIMAGGADPLRSSARVGVGLLATLAFRSVFTFMLLIAGARSTWPGSATR